jgi:hypothetical protein
VSAGTEIVTSAWRAGRAGLSARFARNFLGARRIAPWRFKSTVADAKGVIGADRQAGQREELLG